MIFSWVKVSLRIGLTVERSLCLVIDEIDEEARAWRSIECLAVESIVRVDRIDDGLCVEAVDNESQYEVYHDAHMDRGPRLQCPDLGLLTLSEAHHQGLSSCFWETTFDLPTRFLDLPTIDITTRVHHVQTSTIPFTLHLNISLTTLVNALLS